MEQWRICGTNASNYTTKNYSGMRYYYQTTSFPYLTWTSRIIAVSIATKRSCSGRGWCIWQMPSMKGIQQNPSRYWQLACTTTMTWECNTENHSLSTFPFSIPHGYCAITYLKCYNEAERQRTTWMSWRQAGKSNFRIVPWHWVYRAWSLDYVRLVLCVTINQHACKRNVIRGY